MILTIRFTPGATEICDGKDNDCNGNTDEGAQNTYFADTDSDGYGDAGSTISACNAPVGFVSDNTDCNDSDNSIYPTAPELCDGLDNNCDGNTDEGVLSTFYADNDADGYGDAGITTQACSAPAGFVNDNTDCDDGNGSINPGAAEICDGIDNNCDGNTDEGVLSTFYADNDSDGYGDAGNTTQACSAPAGFVNDNTDCDDSNGSANPGATEVCDGFDNNCDGNIDEGVLNTFYADTDSDGYGDAGSTSQACSAPAGYVGDNTDCDDSDGAVNPGAAEIFDGIDNNCDGNIDEGFSFPPVAGDDSNNTIESTLVLIDVLANDTDLNGDIDPALLSTAGVLQPSNGTVNALGALGIEYTPNAGFIGYDQFEYIICDQSTPTPLCDVALVSVYVSCDGVAPGGDNEISGIVYNDNNTDADQDADESAQSGATVRLYDDADNNGLPDGGAIQTTSTDANGIYRFNLNLSYSQSFLYDQRIQSGGDDAYEQVSKGDVKETSAEIKFGKKRNTDVAGFRFVNVNIPAGATIDDAFMYVDNKESPGKGDITSVNIFAQDDASPVAFSDANPISTRSKTSGFAVFNINWTGGENGASTPDLASVIQEAVDNNGGLNDLALIFNNNSNSDDEAKIWAFEHGQSESARLVINYSSAGGGGGLYHFLTDVDETTLPAGSTLTTPTYQSATFTAAGTEDCDNDFGFLGCVEGNSCDDGNPCTINDVYDAQCACAGTFEDGDNDGTCDANDGCPNDPGKTAPGDCGCGIADVDTDNDGSADCIDGCPNDPDKTAASDCGCGVADTDTDNDGTADCIDGCPNDPGKITAGICGCGVSDADSDNDGTLDCNDSCPNDPDKTAPGLCGCGVADADSDNDGTLDCNDGCPNDPNKTSAGDCGCGVADTDSDNDGAADCNDGCPNDAAKTSPGDCGCGVVDTDSDNDGTADCIDGCPNDPGKTAAGDCGCGVADTDSDNDGTANCIDNCPNDPNKTDPGTCGCGIADTDSDNDGTEDCNDGCPNDPNKTAAGICGCGISDADTDADGVADCNDICPGGDDNIDLNNNNIPDFCEGGADTTEVIDQIAASDNDAQQDRRNIVKINENELKLGKDREVGLRFVDVDIPDGAAIVSAYFEFTSSKTKTGNPSNVVIHGEASINPAAYVASSGNISGRSKTSNSVTWNSIPSWQQDQVYSSPDVSALVQELIDQTGWTDGNPLAFIFDHAGSQERKFKSYDNNPAQAARLVINYTGGTAPMPTTVVGEQPENENIEDDDPKESIAKDALFEALNLYPNPASDQIKISFSHTLEGNARLQVVDISGRTWKDLMMPTIEGINNIEIGVRDLPPGNYFLRISQKGNYEMSNFIVW